MSDETLTLVTEFHKVFGSPVEPTPRMPALEGEMKAVVGSLASLMEASAATCTEAAELANTDTESDAWNALIRLQLLQEELSEFARALEVGDMTAALDALSDIQYVLDGAYLALGLQDLKLPAFREVHRSNMTKLGADGKPIISPAGRVVKGPNYEEPKLKALLFSYLYKGEE